MRHSIGTDVGWSPLYNRRVADALVPATSLAAYAGLQSAAVLCDTAYCNDTWDCNQTQDCQPTADCQSAVAACDDTYACNPTSDETCSGTPTCAGWPTCAEAETCVGAACPSDTFDAEFCGPTAKAMTCLAARTCDADICDWPTYKGLTCTRPTCDGPTCTGDTCEGPTCYLTDCDVFDYGDAPQIAGTPLRYPTTKESDGARHLIDGVYFLGAREDAEMDGQPAVFALGDDEEPYRRGDDEDGIWFSTTFNPGRQAVVIAAASEAGRLFAWADYGMSGDWLDEGDAVFPDGIPLVQGYNWVILTVPETATRSPLVVHSFPFHEVGRPPPDGEGGRRGSRGLPGADLCDVPQLGHDRPAAVRGRRARGDQLLRQ